MSLLDLIKHDKKIISIIGLAKNAGKTEVLNSLLEEGFEKKIKIGVTSIGRDGEKKDSVTNTSKPEIFVEPETIIVTLDFYVKKSDAEIEILKILDSKSYLGTYIVGKVRSSGTIQLAGPNSTKRIKKICEFMLSIGCQKVFIDGALNRISSSAPHISDSAIIATGAAVSNQMDKVVKKTLHQIHLFNLPDVSSIFNQVMTNFILKKDTICLINKDEEIIDLNLKTGLNNFEKIIKEIDNSTKFIIFPGSLTGQMVKKIYSYGYTNIDYIVKDTTKLFISEKLLNEFLNLKINFYVYKSIEVLALTINPFSPQGYHFDPNVFKKEIKNYVKDLPVINVLEENYDNR
ncbi:MAG: hypothetical protein ACQEQE_00295 [Bacillota bacterium]